MNIFKKNRFLLCGALLCLFLVEISVSNAQQIDEIYNAKIKEYTTDPRFLPSSVLDLLDDSKVPSPRKHFGEIAGTPGIMHNTTEIFGYFKELDASSERLALTQIGTSEEGRPMHLAVIADETTMKKLDFYKGQLAKLADPRKISAEEAKSILQTSKPIYYLNAGLHSPETGSPEMLMELAYRLITDTSATIRHIRENVIVIMNPVAEPDGWDKMRDWYYRYGKAKKEFDDPMPSRPPYWGKYAVHDNNRDGFQVSQALTKAVYGMYYDWHPTVFLDLHESVPLIYLSVGTGPYPEHIEPTAINEWSLLSQYEMTELAAQGLPGVFTWAYYDGYYQGYLFWIANNHNSIGRFYETFGNAGANTYVRDIAATGTYAGKNALKREWYRPEPATRYVKWSYRDNLNYMQAGVLAALKYASLNGQTMLRNFYQKGLNNIERGKKESPQVYVIPKQQHDPWMRSFMVNQLRTHGIEVHEVTEGNHGGDYVVLLDQPYRNLAVSLLSEQNYPKDAEHPPHDDLAWTFGYMYGVEVEEGKRADFPMTSLKLMEEDARYIGAVSGNEGVAVINYSAQTTVPGALYWLKNEVKSSSVSAIDEQATLDGFHFNRGSLLVKGLSAVGAKNMAEKFGLDIVFVRDEFKGKQHPIMVPRIAIFHTWDNTQDEGWARFSFEQRGIPYTSIDKDDLRSGNLKDRYDVILLPNTRGNGSQFVHGIDKSLGPMPYTKTKDFPSHGFPDATEDMTGGPGYEGVGNLMHFMEEGGLLITVNGMTSAAAELGLIPGASVKNTDKLFHPGSIVQTRIRKSDSPLLYGFPELPIVFRGSAPLLSVDKKSQAQVLLQYGAQRTMDDQAYEGPILGGGKAPEPKDPLEKDYDQKAYPYVLSGMVRNEEIISGQGAILEVGVGRGHVVAFTFNPLHRFQNQHDMAFVWNSLMHWDHIQAN